MEWGLCVTTVKLSSCGDRALQHFKAQEPTVRRAS